MLNQILRWIFDIFDAVKDSGQSEDDHQSPKGTFCTNFWQNGTVCQEPIAHNQRILETKGADWADKVLIIGLLKDKDIAVIMKHVEEKK